MIRTVLALSSFIIYSGIALGDVSLTHIQPGKKGMMLVAGDPNSAGDSGVEIPVTVTNHTTSAVDYAFVSCVATDAKSQRPKFTAEAAIENLGVNESGSSTVFFPRASLDDDFSCRVSG